MLAADLDTEEREQRTERRDRIEAERQAWVALEDQVREVEQLSDVLVKAMLHEHGFHQHDRGEWRRRRG